MVSVRIVDGSVGEVIRKDVSRKADMDRMFTAVGTLASV